MDINTCESCPITALGNPELEQYARRRATQFIRGLLTAVEVRRMPVGEAVMSCIERREQGTCDFARD